MVVEFARAGEVPKSSVSPDQVKAIVENIQALNSTAFETLQKQLLALNLPGRKPLEYILISPLRMCVKCGNQLKLRKDRHASVTIYDLGTIPGAHFHKMCTGRTCNVTQYYGYYTTANHAIFNSDWEYFASYDTFFSVDLLNQVDAHILIGQLSFKKQADMYKYMHK